MLKHLYIKNYALIDELDIDLDEGFSVITGETGAGKSILLGAIGLLLGQRADSKAIKQGESRCIIEAQLELSNQDITDFFDKEDLDFDGKECIIRRELTSAGKSRAFINDTPASISQLRELGNLTIDIHSQHKNLFLSKEDFQLDILDILAQDKEMLDSYKQTYRRYTKLKHDYEALKSQAHRNKEEEDYLQFQFDQINEIAPQPGEDEELQKELHTLEHAEDIKKALYGSDQLMTGENGIIDVLREVKRNLSTISDVYEPAYELEERIESCYLELKDITSEVSSRAEDIEFDPQRLAFVSERLNILYTLEQKHHVESCDELLTVKANLQSQLDAINNSDENIAEAERKMNEAYAEVINQADALTKLRAKSAKMLHNEMITKLKPMGMPNVNFEISLSKREQPDSSGVDKVDFMFSANKNGVPQSIATIASGGEIARVMLSLKAIISKATALPTIIFDEIDTGVSGQIAERMAEVMKEMCSEQGTQVISITHLPQIAALGDAHYKVYKEDNETTTTSHIVRLTTDQRVEELAHMLSGSTITEAALANAKSLLGK